MGHTVIKIQKYQIPKDYYLFILATILLVIEMLPIINIMPPLIISAVKLFTIVLFFVSFLFYNSTLFIVTIVLMFFSCVINIIAYYHCYKYYSSFVSFMIKSSSCWAYMMIGLFLYKYCSDQVKVRIKALTLLLVVITVITSVISLKSTPTALRELGNGSLNIKGMERSLYRRNTATFGIAYGYVFLLPYFIALVREKKNVKYLLVVALIEFCIIKSQITTAIIFSLCFLLFLIIKPPSFKKFLIVFLIVLAFFGIISQMIQPLVELIYRIVQESDNAILKLRVSQIYMLVSSHNLAGTGTIEGRFDLYFKSIETFIKYPFLGYKITSEVDLLSMGMHSQIFDLAASTGVTGLFLLLICFSIIVRYSSTFLSGLIKRYWCYSVLFLVLLNFINPTYYSSPIYLCVFWGPCLLPNEKRESILFRNFHLDNSFVVRKSL